MKGSRVLFAVVVGAIAGVGNSFAASRADFSRTANRVQVHDTARTAAKRTNTSRASRAVETNTSRVATGNLASRAITKALSGATSRRGATKNTVVGRAGTLHGARALPNYQDGFITMSVDDVIKQKYNNINTYITLGGGRLVFQLTNNQLPSLEKLFQNIKSSGVTITGITDHETIIKDHMYYNDKFEWVGPTDNKMPYNHDYYLRAGNSDEPEQPVSNGGDTAAAAVMASYNSLSNAETLRSGTVEGIEYEVVRMGDDEMCIAFRIFNGEYHPMGTVRCDVTVEELASEEINVSF